MLTELSSLRFPVSYIQLATEIASYKKWDMDILLTRKLGLKENLNVTPRTLITGEQIYNILNVTSHFIQEEENGQKLLFGFLPLTIHGPLGLAAITAENRKIAIETVAHYFYQVMPAFEFITSIEGDQFKIKLTRVADFKDHNNFFLELVVCGIQSMLFFSESSYEKINFNFSHQSLVLTQFQTFFPNANIALDCDENIISFPVAMIDCKLATANNITFKLMQEELKRATQRLGRQHTLTYRVTSILFEVIKTAQSIELSEIAGSLGLSTRSLSRHLKDENTSFKALHNQCRITVAKSLLNESNQRINTIAYQLGFLNEASFSRNFKQQTGISPNEYRNEKK